MKHKTSWQGEMKSKKLIQCDELSPRFRSGMRLMFGGFMGVGTPSGLVAALLAAEVTDLTLIGNDTATADSGVGPLIAQHRVKHLIVSHIGGNPLAGQQMIAGTLDVELVPQGTLAERIRCGGAGLGGVLTPTGLGTSVQDGKTVVNVGGRDYLLELPLRADVAIVKAHRADHMGNLTYYRSERNFNPLIALAADIVIVEVEEIVDTGAIDPDQVVTPGALVDYIVASQRSH
jgi:acetate CoA/acetoacetate CoA-transferase alpha subunit